MLTSLYVRNFAVVEAAEITFGPGLTVVSGETGAGKSLLVDALLLLSGARADAGVVRAGSDRAELSAEFSLADLPLAQAWLADEALDDEGACRLRRVIPAEGSSRAWINGRPASATQLGDLTALLIDIHGQHEHQALLSRAHQLELLDACVDDAPLLARVRDGARLWREAGARMRELGGGADRDGRIELLRHEVDELEQWALDADGLAALEANHRRLANAEHLATGTAGIVEALDGESEFAAQRVLGRARDELARLAALDARLAPTAELIDSATIQLAEAGSALAHYLQDVDLDPARFAEVDAELARVHGLSRRHHVPAAELPARRDELKRQLDDLLHAGEELTALAAQRAKLAAASATAQRELTAARRAAAQRLEATVNALMPELGMTGGRIAVEFEAAGGTEPDPQGSERCEFLVSANPGQPPRPLRKVASGGELARISLALEVALLGKDTRGSMVFDEVDAGIGGAIAEVVGQKLHALARHCQVLCVTHLPQVAAQGDQHLVVSKHTDGESTRTEIQLLDERGRREELARMLGGIEITPETRAHARQMLASARTD